MLCVFAFMLLPVSQGCKKTVTELPVVAVEPARQDDVEIYGEYVGRVRAQQFVEVRARVEGYLEKMLFEEGTYVKKGQVLFVINPDTYRAKVDKARAQLKKDEAQALKAKRDLERIRPLHEQNAASRLDLDNAVAAYETANASVSMSRADLAQAEGVGSGDVLFQSAIEALDELDVQISHVYCLLIPRFLPRSCRGSWRPARGYA